MSDSYNLLLKQLEALLSTERDPLANAANLSSLLYHNLNQVNWLGFYIKQNNHLVLGPFHGQPACARIAIGQGVCGTAFATKTIQIVADVHDFEGHIVCDAASQSELVIPFEHNKISGVLDVDSPKKERFGYQEQVLLEEAVKIYLESIN